MMHRFAYILDDDPRVRATVSHVLTGVGYEAREFSSPEPMLARIAAMPPELVVLDLSLGQSDAVEVIRQLAAAKYQGKVLLVSGHDEAVISEVQRIGTRHGLAMLASLHKPFRGSELVGRLTAPVVVVEAPEPKQESERVAIDLVEALDGGWLELWYQPKIDLQDFSVCSAEALVRARHPQHGIVFPAEFLPPPGDSRHQALAEFVVARAMADWRHLADAGLPLKLSVNMPASAINAPDFISLIRRSLPADHRFPGLMVEVTEDEMIKDAESIHEASAQLKLLNVGLSIDDFGVAHSSMSRLLELPCVELKLDRKFVANCAADRLKHAVCKTVIDLAHRVGNVVCAEGVENPDDLRCVVEMGCDTLQGFIFAKPMGLDIFIARLSALQSQFVERYAHWVVAPARLRGSG
jgi:EAL domain-containing protein (putative c-di-GMP-specific phosphodiesterase class I)/FixJ family two-component response regulator